MKTVYNAMNGTLSLGLMEADALPKPEGVRYFMRGYKTLRHQIYELVQTGAYNKQNQPLYTWVLVISGQTMPPGFTDVFHKCLWHGIKQGGRILQMTGDEVLAQLNMPDYLFKG